MGEESEKPKATEDLGENFYTVKQLAAKLGYSSIYIAKRCRLGFIKAYKPLGGDWRISPAEARRVIEEGLSPVPKPATQEREARPIEIPAGIINNKPKEKILEEKPPPEKPKRGFPIEFKLW